MQDAAATENPFEKGFLFTLARFFEKRQASRQSAKTFKSGYLASRETLGSPASAADFLRAGLRHMEDRAVTYDAQGGERSMAKTVEMFNVYSGLELTEEQGWMFMVLLKVVRSGQGNFKADNYEDLAAYGGLSGEAALKERG